MVDKCGSVLSKNASRIYAIGVVALTMTIKTVMCGLQVRAPLRQNSNNLDLVYERVFV